MVSRKVKCKVCKDTFQATKERTAGKGNSTTMTSKDGISFNGYTWFCNKCWDKIIEYVKEEHIW